MTDPHPLPPLENNLEERPSQPPATADEGTLAAAPGLSPDAVDGAQTPADRKAGRNLLTGRAARELLPSLSYSPSRLAWRQLRKNRAAMFGLWTLVAMYLIAIFGQFVAPYDYQDQSPGGENLSYHPPMKLRWRDARTGGVSLVPFVYGTRYQEGDYLPDPEVKRPLRFFVTGAPFKLWGFLPMNRHLFGSDAGPVYVLGTDNFGRDYFSRLLYGSMISLSVGFIGIFITFSLGMLVGGIAGFYGGKTDDIIMRLCEILMSVPDFYLLLALAAALPPDLNPVVVYVLIIGILSLVGWAGMARVVRGMVLSVRERPYVEAGRALGVSDLQIIVRHILPSTFTYAVIAATMSVPGYILAEAGLSFLGLGIRPPMASWGNMLSDAQELATLTLRPWILAPGYVIFVTTLAFNFLGDGLRDALDPKSRRLG